MSDLSFYPEIEPYSSGRLQVSPLHEMYYEEVGNNEGVPVIFLHGGPGGGISPKYRRFFDCPVLIQMDILAFIATTAIFTPVWT